MLNINIFANNNNNSVIFARFVLQYLEYLYVYFLLNVIIHKVLEYTILTSH